MTGFVIQGHIYNLCNLFNTIYLPFINIYYGGTSFVECLEKVFRKDFTQHIGVLQWSSAW